MRRPTTAGGLVFLSPTIRLPLTPHPAAHPLPTHPLPTHPLLSKLLNPPRPVRAALSGALAEVLVHLALYPLDTWKTHRHYPAARRGSPFAGARVGLVGVALDAAVFSLAYHCLRRATRHLPTASSTLLSAALSTIASTAVDAPFTLARDRIRLGLATGSRDAWRRAARTSWRGLYAGAAETVVRDLPLEAIEFSTYEALKNACSNVRRVKPVDMLALGMVTGAITGAIVSPLDLVVTRCVADPARYTGVFSTMGKVVKEAGVGAVFSGIGHKIVREAASSALFFCVYDSLLGEDD